VVAISPNTSGKIENKNLTDHALSARQKCVSKEKRK